MIHSDPHQHKPAIARMIREDPLESKSGLLHDFFKRESPPFDKGGRGDIEKGFVILSHRLAVLSTSLSKGGVFGLLYFSPKDDQFFA